MIVEIAKASAEPEVRWRHDPWRQLRELWARMLRVSRRQPRQLRIAESVSLGERRFVAVIEFAQARYLVGGTSSSLVLLAQVDDGNKSAAGAEALPELVTSGEQT